MAVKQIKLGDLPKSELRMIEVGLHTLGGILADWRHVGRN